MISSRWSPQACRVATNVESNFSGKPISCDISYSKEVASVMPVMNAQDSRSNVKMRPRAENAESLGGYVSKEAVLKVTLLSCYMCTRFYLMFVRTATLSPEESTSHDVAATQDNTHSDRNSVGFLLNFSTESEFLHEFPPKPNMGLESRIANFRNLMAVSDGLTPVVGEFAIKVSPGYRPCGLLDTDKNPDDLLNNLELDALNGILSMQGDDSTRWMNPGCLISGQTLLERRAEVIREALRHTIAKISMPHEPSNEVIQAVELITAYNLVLYAQLYFHHWHKNTPIVHHSTFNLFTTAIPLVLAILALGGMYSNNSIAIANLKLLFDPIEAYLFSLPGWSDEYELNRIYHPVHETATDQWQQYQLDELQAGFLIILLQYWTGNMVARNRVSQHRFQKWVDIARRQGLFSVKHPPDVIISDESSFRAWITKESYIRTANMSIIIDITFDIFHNIAPRIRWSEMDFSLSSDDSVFQAANYQELVIYAGIPRAKMKLKEAFLLLLTPREKAEEAMRRLKSGNLTIADMQALMYVFYTHIWAATFSNPLSSVPFSNCSNPSPNPLSSTDTASHITTPFRSALTVWKKLWDDLKLSTDRHEWFRLGFQRSAETYYNAVTAILKAYEELRDRCAKEGNAGGWWDIIGSIPSNCARGEHLRRILGAGPSS
ncbi:hypothetical protein B7463_g24, partial [Scytalidium lignicola]